MASNSRTEPGFDAGTLPDTSLGEIVERVRAGEREIAWDVVKQLLRIVMPDERGEVVVVDEEGTVCCYVSSKAAHDELVRASIPTNDPSPNDLCDVGELFDSPSGS